MCNVLVSIMIIQLWKRYVVVNCTANCGHPMASRNVQLYVYNSTLERASVVFTCNEGFFPNETHTGVAMSEQLNVVP